MNSRVMNNVITACVSMFVPTCACWVRASGSRLGFAPAAAPVRWWGSAGADISRVADCLRADKSYMWCEVGVGVECEKGYVKERSSASYVLLVDTASPRASGRGRMRCRLW